MLQTGSQVHKSKRFNIDQADFSLKNGVIMCGHTIVVFKIFGPQILKELHSGHFEEVKMTNMARCYAGGPVLTVILRNWLKIVQIVMRIEIIHSKEMYISASMRAYRFCGTILRKN